MAVHPPHGKAILSSILLLATILLASDLAPRDCDAGANAVLSGIDVLRRDDFRQLAGRNVGLITNQTGRDRTGASSIRLLHEAPQVNLVTLFSPEHGILGELDVAFIRNDEDAATGIRIFSLYGGTRRPQGDMLAGLDTLVFDIQDIGTRFYTYISTMGEAMLAAAENDIRFVVLDRPNPINGVTVAGPVLDEGRQSFVAFHRLAVRHGMTVGELARMFRAELQLNLELEVIAIENWNRADYLDTTGLEWVNPSPNMRSLAAAILYPGTGLLETTNLSVGRGTATPFEVLGAPWLDGDVLTSKMDSLELPGILFTPVSFTPESSKFKGETCSGVRFTITDRTKFDPLRTGLELAVQLRRLHAKQWEIGAYDRLLGNRAVLEAIQLGHSYMEIKKLYLPELVAFRQRRLAFLIYDWKAPVNH